VACCCRALLHAETGVASRRLGAVRPRGAPKATSRTPCRPRLPGLPPGDRVVALGKSTGCHTLSTLGPVRSCFWRDGYPGDCPPGEGMLGSKAS
jgi:hypothetical protein